MAKFSAYIDDFDTITIITNQHYDNEPEFTLKGHNEIIKLFITKRDDLGEHCKYIVQFDAYVFLNKTYKVVDSKHNETELFTGKIVRTKQFDTIYYYNGSDLGHTYTKKQTTFKLWSPVAKQITLYLKKDNETTHHDLTYTNQGVWAVTINENLDSVGYYFKAYVNGKMITITDPYAIASAANGAYSHVINPKKLYSMTASRPDFSGVPTDAIIYETSIRDLTMDETLHLNQPGTFNAAIKTGVKTKENNPVGFDYIKSLGITHLQIMPFFDFEGVDEVNPKDKYNWGYNPAQFNVVEGSYSVKPNAPYDRINGLRKLVDRYHNAGISIVMDVVYNHVYNVNTFSLGKLIPGYVYRVDERGILTNNSGCGNDLATEHKMIRKFIVDSVLYWCNQYQLDGFRFDLMGLIDVSTMHAVRQHLESVRKEILVYGEGWKMTSNESFAHMRNKSVLYNIGFFNDRMRETIKGSTFNQHAGGYISERFDDVSVVKDLLQGSIKNDFLFTYPTQSINYIECHDNHTVYDKLSLVHNDSDDSLLRKRQALGTSMVILAQGVPFIHMGQEFYRSKNGVENSYKSNDKINKIDWALTDTYKDAINTFKELIQLRKTTPLFRLKNRTEIFNKTQVKAKDTGTIIYELFDNKTHLYVIFKPTETIESLTFDKRLDILYQSSEVQLEDSTLTLDTISTTILKG